MASTASESTTQGTSRDLLEQANEVLTATGSDTLTNLELADNLIGKLFQAAQKEDATTLTRSLLWSLLTQRHHPLTFDTPLLGFTTALAIGEGSYTKVYHAKYRYQEQGEDIDVAVKVLKQDVFRVESGVKGQPFKHLDDLVNAAKQWRLMGSHPNIYRFYGCSARVDFEKEAVAVAFVFELAIGTLKELHSVQGNLPSDTLKRILDFAKGIQVIHDDGSIHGDIALDTVLMFEDGRAKLPAFSFSKYLGATSITTDTSDERHTRWQVARVGPEVAWAGQACTQKSDIFGFGSLVYELFAGSPPSFGDGPSLKTPPRPENMPDGIWSVVSPCWHEHPEGRPSAGQLVWHVEWLVQSKS